MGFCCMTKCLVLEPLGLQKHNILGFQDLRKMLHFARVLAGRLTSNTLEIPDEVGLVGIPKLIGKRCQISVGIEHDGALDGVEADGAGKRLRRRADLLLKIALELTDRQMTIVRQLLDAILPLGMVEQLAGGLHDAAVELSSESPLDEKGLKPHRRPV